ncbi:MULTISPECIES: ABC transporter ATP-binding protein [unclassified Aureimonas]|uniref:ABC transporter ATP-binding protein n=1 Tax=unclassified Aureimonas TaxID=2615206 RepID=UPI0006FED63E|nr:MULTISPECIES: ABC transporter ATP-binding protein [unclassified Aureimonas]KQT57358.1 sugar ABC transporter ATP-binding protein [Aureimonas sp. Leaf427]KQT77036.1 sugar ABC transporter ATP-binding protein [Aureimonas sp. Leaf460]
MSVEFQSLFCTFGAKRALDGFDLTVEPQSFTVICGPPASGKSVLFRILVGLEKPDSGRILLSGRDITALPPAERPIGYVPQSFALYPHQTVAQNMAYPLTLAKAPKDEIARRVDRTAGILAITHLLKKTPDQLSGGEKQRVAVARGLLKNAEIFVLDDPLVGLDYKLRERLMDELKSLREELKATFLYATSDSLEALTMAQRLVVLDKGRVVQHDEAITVYDEPAHVRSLDLVGFPHANLVPGTISAGRLQAGPLTAGGFSGIRDGEIVAGLRPEAVRLGSDDTLSPSGTLLDLPAEVTLVENLGGEAVVYLESAGYPLTATLPLSGALPPELGAKLRLAIDPADIMLFDRTTGARLDKRLSGGLR